MRGEANSETREIILSQVLKGLERELDYVGNEDHWGILVKDIIFVS